MAISTYYLVRKQYDAVFYKFKNIKLFYENVFKFLKKLRSM